MDTSAMSGLLQQLQAAAGQAGQTDASAAQSAGGTPNFAEALTHSIDRIDALKTQAVESGRAYESGQPGVGLNDVMVNMAKADVATNMGIQVRNRVVSAYQDIMNMQV
ncbi:flagellar hook-basal body complex protein FliE [Salinisphaera sp. Q1T1-3]|uniref:flagellar hook-basal body complex protein FliE n=1 Tax=Salinisphaera sp. Q1T1-3 TaxID=2321229 RepID=UPI000E750E44|nr:flagellar hook-basal body complex protein FliE [Salinisphaera sp. Q1T1-3]RJS95149.1 flagellar hook-basal body complex protein FliE [Salinisphaera sp. Q1T1-3]